MTHLIIVRNNFTFLKFLEADSQKEENDELDETNNLLSNKAVLITCSLAIIYIICVVVLMIWCRQRRGMKRQSETDPENLKLNDENEVSSKGFTIDYYYFLFHLSHHKLILINQFHLSDS